MSGIHVHSLEFFPYDDGEYKHIGERTVDVSSYTPLDPTDFHVNVNIAIGWTDSAGVMRFNVYVCSPKAMVSGKLEENTVFSGRSYIFMQEYDEAAFKEFLASYVAGLQDLPYTQQIERMCRLGDWEFEDCKNADGSPFVTHDITFHDKSFLPENSTE